MFIKIIDKELFLCQIYVDDIIFGLTNKEFCKEFGDMMYREFEMLMIDELNYFLGFQIKQLKKRDVHPSREVHEGHPQEVEDE